MPNHPKNWAFFVFCNPIPINHILVVWVWTFLYLIITPIIREMLGILSIKMWSTLPVHLGGTLLSGLLGRALVFLLGLGVQARRGALGAGQALLFAFPFRAM